MNVPMIPNLTVDLVPIYIAGGKDTTVGSQKIGIGQYGHLTYAAQVTGDAIYLMVLSRSDSI